MTTEQQLTKFREEWKGIHVTQQEDMLIYKVAPGFGKSASDKANKLIEAMELPLLSVPTSFQANDSFIVKIKENETRKEQH